MTEPSVVRTDVKKDKNVTIYLVLVGVAGLGLVVASAVLGWGFYGYGGGAFLMLAGFGGLIGKAKEGGFAEAPCPGCGELLKFQFEKQARIMKCEACGVWSEGTETMARVPDDRVADYPVFTTPMPADGVRWPTRPDGERACPLCDAAATGTQKIEGSDPLGLTAAAVSPVSVRRVHSIDAPVCPEHTDGVALFVSGSDLALGFRSRAYQLRFEAENATE